MRTKSRNISIHKFENNISVECPKCKKEAIVSKKDEKYFSERKCICTNCGFSNQWKGDSLSYFWHEGEMFDPAFHYRLFYQSNIKGNHIWAFNRKHITFLEDCIKAKLREKAMPNHQYHGSLEATLPKWMTAHKNREAVLKALKKIKAKT